MPREGEGTRLRRRLARAPRRPAPAALMRLALAALASALLAPLLLAAAAPASGQEIPAGTIYGRPPVCSYIPALRYPPSVRDRSLGGDVLVSVHLDRRGRIARTDVLETDLPQIFVVEALRAVNLSRFHPAWHAGRTVESILLMPFRFLPQEEAPSAERTAAGTEAASAADETRLGRPQAEAPAPDARREIAGEIPAEPPALPNADAGAELRLVDAAFGLGVNAGRLRDAADTFVEGERVYFWTRVDGAPEGEHTPLRHVWFWRGREVQTITLSLKGPSWRTWSYKTLFGGLAGEWRVEARDAEGRLLGARAFTCLPREGAED